MSKKGLARGREDGLSGEASGVAPVIRENVSGAISNVTEGEI